MNKRDMRAFLRSRFEGANARNEQSMRLCQHVLRSPIYKSAKVIGGYMPMPREADVAPILMDALRQGKTLALPLCGKAPDMTFRKVTDMKELQVGSYGLLEPSVEAAIIPVEDIDLLLVPLEGIDALGYRLGKGGGYYDKALTGQRIMSLGCALKWQWADAIPHDPWDVPLRACADADGIHRFMKSPY